MSLWSALVSENPMLLESRRLMRRFLRPSGNQSLNMAVMLLAGLAVLVLTVSVWNGRTVIPPISIVIAQTGLLTLIVPSIAHGVFAGERERRSWDLLLVAPIRKSQIVTGKLLGCLTGVVATAAFFALPFLITAGFYEHADFRLALLAEAESLSFAFLLVAIGFAISARAKRAFTALGGTIALLALVLGVLPYLISQATQGSAEFHLWVYPHPFVSLYRLYEAGEGVRYVSYVNDFQNPDSVGIQHQAIILTVGYFVAAIGLLLYTVRSLEAEDGDGKFRLRRKHA